jgi:serine/threonine-protein kinase
MGSVYLVRDRRIGRDVAMKVLQPEMHVRSDGPARFEREARVQGQLEHPGVVPVYDLGVDERGHSFFTMKRVRGRTLADVLNGLRARDEAIEARYSTRRLLSAFSQLCLTVAFAHSRGVLHRDIKPGNVMLGDFGEVHLLDWGIATVAADLRPQDGQADEQTFVDAALSERHRTLAGEMLGTPGYMSPEQIVGDAAHIDARSDIFSLGAVLFEILTLEPLLPEPRTVDVVEHTLRGVDARAAARAPHRDVSPELETVCIRATAPLESRYASVRELHRDVERFLDGDRDHERRRQLADERVERAERAVAAGGDAARSPALQDLAAALALDPTNVAAQRLLGRLRLFGPDEFPKAARDELEERRKEGRPAVRRTILLATLAFPIAGAATALLGIRSLGYFTAMMSASLLVCLAAFVCWRLKDDRYSPFLILVSAMLAASVHMLVAGPLVVVPTVALAIAATFVSFGSEPLRLASIGLGVLAVLAPLGMQLAGVLPASYTFEGGVMQVLPLAAELPQQGTLAYMAATSVASIIIISLIVFRQRQSLSRLEERLFLHVWNLRGLLPEGARVSLPSIPEPRVEARRRSD